MSDSVAPPVSQLGVPALGTLDVAAFPTPGQGLALDQNSRIPAGAAKYATYTPTLVGSGGGTPTLGNATVISRFVQVGKFVHTFGVITLGSTTNFGTGALVVALPVPAAYSGLILGLVDVFQSSTGAYGLATGYVGVNTSHFQILFGATYLGARTSVSGSLNTPWAWGTSDAISWNLSYEAA